MSRRVRRPSAVPESGRQSGIDQPAGTSPAPGAQQALRAAFLRRAVPLLERLSERASPEVLTAALAAPSDVGGVASLLSDLAPLGIELETVDPLAEAMARGAAAKEELLRSAGGALAAGTVARALGISRQAVDKRRRRGALLAVPSGSGDHLYPACQFTESGGVLSGLDEVLAAFEVRDPWVQLAVLLGAAPSLDGRSAVEALREGDVEGAAAVARAFGEQGA